MSWLDDLIATIGWSKNGGAEVSPRRAKVNLIEGEGTSITIADNQTAQRTDITITATAGGGGSISPLSTLLFSDFSADPGGDGSLATPFDDPNDAVAAAPADGTILDVAGSTFTGDLDARVAAGPLRIGALGGPDEIYDGLALPTIDGDVYTKADEAFRLQGHGVSGSLYHGANASLILANVAMDGDVTLDPEEDPEADFSSSLNARNSVVSVVDTFGCTIDNSGCTSITDKCVVVSLKDSACSNLQAPASGNYGLRLVNSFADISLVDDDPNVLYDGEGNGALIDENSRRLIAGPSTQRADLPAGDYDDLNLGPYCETPGILTALTADRIVLYLPGDVTISGLTAWRARRAFPGHKDFVIHPDSPGRATIIADSGASVPANRIHIFGCEAEQSVTLGPGDTLECDYDFGNLWINAKVVRAKRRVLLLPDGMQTHAVVGLGATFAVDDGSNLPIPHAAFAADTVGFWRFHAHDLPGEVPIRARIHWYTPSTAESIAMQIDVCALKALAAESILDKAFPGVPVLTGDLAVSATANELVVTDVVLPYDALDGLVAGDMAQLRVTRIAPSEDDDAADALKIVAIELVW